MSLDVRFLCLRNIDFRVPKRGELYLDKNDMIQRLHEDRTQSKRAKKRVILQEVWRQK